MGKERRIEKCLVEEEQLFVNIDSWANCIIVKRVHLFDKLNRFRKSALRTVNGQVSLQIEGIGEIGIRREIFAPGRQRT